MKKILILLLPLLLVSAASFGQKFLAIDKYKAKRIRLQVGDEVRYKLKGNKTVFKDQIKSLNDSTVTMVNADTNIPLSLFDEFRFNRNAMDVLSGGTAVLGVGFLLSGAIHPLVGDPTYSQEEAFVMGGSFAAISGIFRLLRWNKYKVGTDKARVQILDTSFGSGEGISNQ